MTDFPWLTVLGAVPLVGAVGVALLPRGRDLLAKQVALAVSLVALVLTLAVALRFDPDVSGFQLTETHAWIPQFGISYAVGVDGIALVLLGLTAILTPICILAAWHDADAGKRSVKAYFALILVLETMCFGVFSATDVFLFYFFFEAMLVPMYFIIGSYGGAQRSYAAVKFLLYSLLGGMLMLAALIGLYVVSPGGDQAFLLDNLIGMPIDATTGKWLFLGFFAAFAVKAPMWPVHTWLPDAASEAPPSGAVLLVGVLDKVGTFGMIRLCLPLFPDASKWATPAIIVLATVGVIYGALLAIGQRDVMRLIAYTSISHFGIMVLGIFAMTSQGQAGATLYMLNHGLVTGALFLIAGMMIHRRGSRMIADFGGVQRVAPMIAGSFLVAGLAGLALPGLNSFVSEFLSLVGTFTRYPAAAIVATTAIILAAIYILLTYQRMCTGPVTEHTKSWTDMTRREVWVVAPLIAVIVALGFYPKPVLDVITPAVQTTMTQVGVQDPAPTVPVAEGTQQ
ncbi:MAG TPA: NADH-quinone oxidoreductase subunit M [Actinomycetes bacterium]|nr:NADH-quinone oxidoreductase subunit M [Actinomycetes bacterium]